MIIIISWQWETLFVIMHEHFDKHNQTYLANLAGSPTSAPQYLF